MKKLLLSGLLLGVALMFTIGSIQEATAAEEDPEPTVTKCPGKGEKCVLDGVGWPVFSKGKDEPALVIEL